MWNRNHHFDCVGIEWRRSCIDRRRSIDAPTRSASFDRFIFGKMQRRYREHFADARTTACWVRNGWNTEEYGGSQQGWRTSSASALLICGGERQIGQYGYRSSKLASLIGTNICIRVRSSTSLAIQSDFRTIFRSKC